MQLSERQITLAKGLINSGYKIESLTNDYVLTLKKEKTTINIYPKKQK